ncbi:MAG: response regulator transcription factor [Peptostreptococcaceae bacterium]|nr:response regulator transcription factor [Peptostreptococcaceae bacterium]
MEKMFRFLIVDDEPLLVKGIKFSLEEDGHQVDTAYSGDEALNKILGNEYDLILLDLMLPKIDGFEICKQVRKVSEVPIIFLSARGEDISKIKGLDIGADDYITKPFNIVELKARINAVIRRTNSPSKFVADKVFSDFVINPIGRKFYRGDREINLTSKEFDLLLVFLNSPNKVFSREELLNLIWGHEHYGDYRTVDVHIRKLREKIEKDPSNPSYIMTKWGEGYYYSTQEI